jgi:uncharacterized membrane protein
MSMEDRTETIQTRPETEATREHREAEAGRDVARVERARDWRATAGVDRHEAVAYDPYATRRAISWRIIQTIWLVFGVIEGLITIRFVLRALGANASAGFAEFIYGITALLVAPFVGLFSNPTANGTVLELNSVVAMIAYALLGWLLAKVAWLIIGENRSAVTSRSTTIDTRS